MAYLLFGRPCVRQKWAWIYWYNNSILIYSNQKLHTCYRFGRASTEYNTNFTEADLQRKTNCYYALKPIDQVLIALQCYAFGGLLQVIGDTTGVDKSTVSLAKLSFNMSPNELKHIQHELSFTCKLFTDLLGVNLCLRWCVLYRQAW